MAGERQICFSAAASLPFRASAPKTARRGGSGAARAVRMQPRSLRRQGVAGKRNVSFCCLSHRNKYQYFHKNIVLVCAQPRKITVKFC